MARLSGRLLAAVALAVALTAGAVVAGGLREEGRPTTAAAPRGRCYPAPRPRGAGVLGGAG
ncbi:hypothetical protein, partial [Streptomyces lasiicapitis]|uniref:hypothetical protein n=1 Tax=Streptomyces lasiicapitis TaxID=1923961 RepID=UPI00365FECE4